MKNLKNLLPLFALLLGVTLVFTQSAFTSATPKVAKETSKYWYEVEDGVTTNYYDHGTKAQMISQSDCTDVLTKPICLFGSDEEVAPNTAIGTPAAENRVLRTQ